jgi:hypothetical protein
MDRRTKGKLLLSPSHLNIDVVVLSHGSNCRPPWVIAQQFNSQLGFLQVRRNIFCRAPLRTPGCEPAGPRICGTVHLSTIPKCKTREARKTTTDRSEVLNRRRRLSAGANFARRARGGFLTSFEIHLPVGASPVGFGTAKGRRLSRAIATRPFALTKEGMLRNGFLVKGAQPLYGKSLCGDTEMPIFCVVRQFGCCHTRRWRWLTTPIKENKRG